MKKRLTSLILSLALVLSLIPQIFAYDPSTMTDISGHWAEANVAWAMEQNLFQGVSETEFSPDGSMTRGMFVTVLGRLAGINQDDYDDWYLSNLYTDVPEDSYYAKYINWATRYGIAKGMGDGLFMPDKPVTREQIATFVIRFTSIYNYDLTAASDTIVEYFTDADTISSYAAEAVDAMRITGLINGRQNDDGTYRFDPQAEATRAEAATIFCRLAASMQENTTRELIAPAELYILPEDVTLTLGETTSLVYELLPQEATNQTVTWVSENPAVASVTADGMVTAISEGTAEIYAYTWNGLFGSCTVTCEREVSLSYAGETYEEKCMRIFGEVVSYYGYSYRNYYTSAAEAKSHMVPVVIKAWDFADSSRTTKITKQYTIYVHENIADTVVAIFDEIYNGDEQFPIHSVGGYRWDYDSEHTIGVAIDINPKENYYYSYRTGQQVGSYWKPGEDPYSIPLDGDVAQAFAKYGFRQGIWNSAVDYMHFSYFGT